MNYKTLCVLLLYSTTVLLIACGGGAGEVAGIEGSGAPITSAGVITDKGSIFVNDVEYDLTGAAVTIDGDPASGADLDVGGIVIVEGELNPDGTGATGKAHRVTAGIAVAGPISAIDQIAQRLTVLGQAVVVDAGTRIIGGVDGQPIGGLAVGDDVEVSGFADSTGTLFARRIAPRSARTPLRVTGYAVLVDTALHRFAINGQTVDYTNATLVGFGGRDLAGAAVRVDADDIDASGAIVATDVVYRAPGLPGGTGDRAALEGWVTRFASTADFDVDGHPVVTTSATKVDEPGQDLASLVRLDAFIEIKGRLIGNGVVEATEVLLVNAVRREFVVADMNGDGQEDVVAATSYVDAEQNRIGAVEEFLDPPLSFPVGCDPGAIAVGDLNNDGLADVIAPCNDANDAHLLLQKPSGGGQLLPWTPVAIPEGVGIVAIADVDGDGLSDVVGIAGNPPNTVVFATQKSAAPGTFNTAVTVGEGRYRLIAADLNGDGLVDFGTLNPTTSVNVPFMIEYVQDPAVPGTFHKFGAAVCPSMSGCSISSGQFTVSDMAGPPLVATGDFTARSCNNCPRGGGSWWRQFGRPVLHTKPGLGYGRLATADVDGDGRGDVVMLLATGRSFDVYLQTAPDTFVRDANYSIPTTAASLVPWGIVIADIDHDGLPDVAVSTGELYYFPQDSTARGKFGPAVKIGP